MTWLVEQRNGIFLPEINWHLDARKPAPNVFISHAHFDHFGNHPSILCSQGTAHLLKARMGGQREWRAYAFQEKFELVTGVQGELFPAGHIPGSAMLLLEKEESTLLYTGDFKLSSHLSAETCIVPKADTLVIETTYGVPKYAFPPVSEVVKDIVQFCRETIDDGQIPVLFGYSLGKAQEVLKCLEGSGLRILLHPQVLKMTQTCEEIGFTFPEYSEFKYECAKGSVVISPPLSESSKWLAGIPQRRTAMLSGWALDSHSQYSKGTDRAFPLSDHADFLDLLDFVAQVEPKVVYTTHGFSREFAETLRDRGVNAFELGAQNQMGLEIAIPDSSEPTPSRANAPSGAEKSSSAPNALIHLALANEQAEKADSQKRKLEIVSEYLASLDATDVSLAALFLSGNAFPRAARRVPSVTAKTNRQAILFAANADESDYKRARQTCPSPEAALLSLLGNDGKEGLSLEEVRALLDNLQKSPNPVFQHSLLVEAYRKLGPQEAKALSRLVLGASGAGVEEAVIEEAIAQRFNEPVEQVKRANLRCSDLVKVANAAIDHMLEYVPTQLFFPLLLEKPGKGGLDFEFLARFEPPLWVEDQYDGLRCQIHKVDERVELFDPTGHRINHRFPEIVESARLIPQDYIADGILVAWKKERPLPYAVLEARLNRPVEDLFVGEDTDTLLWLFDLFWFNGDSLIDRPLSFRKRELDTFSVNPKLRISPVHRLDSTEKLPTLLKESKKRGNSGLIIKDATRSYNPLSSEPSWYSLE